MPEVKNSNVAVSNGIPAPEFDLPIPDTPEVITANALKLIAAKSPRETFVFDKLITHLHQFVTETNITTEEWMHAIQFLTRVGQNCTPIRQEFILLSDILGVSALVDALNNRGAANATESSVFGPFWTDDAPDVQQGESIASEGKGDYMYVEGRVLTTDGKPIPNAVIDTWEADSNGFYDTQYKDRTVDCRGRLRSDQDGKYGYRAVVPTAYPVPGDGPVGELLVRLGRHNMRPNHIHLMIEAPGFRKLTTAVYPEGDVWLKSDSVFGVKKSLVVTFKDVNSVSEARKRGFPTGDSFKLLEFDIILEEEASGTQDGKGQISG